MNIMGWVFPALPFALAVDRVFNGLTRPSFGWVAGCSRKKTVLIAFTPESGGIPALYLFGHEPDAFAQLASTCHHREGPRVSTGARDPGFSCPHPGSSS